MSKIFPVILCGGEGMRLWPMSRREYPKQFLPLAGDVSLLQGTIERLDSAAFETPIALCHQDQRFLVAEQLRAADQDAITVVAEPHGRGTAAAAPTNSSSPQPARPWPVSRAGRCTDNRGIKWPMTCG